STGGVITRTRNAFASMSRLERHRGHFYNWYDTRSLRPLAPLYVSSVDSGNLVGHLLTFGSGLAELIDEPIVPPHLFAGLHDTRREIEELKPERIDLKKLQAELRHHQVPHTLTEDLAALRRIAVEAERLAASISSDVHADLRWWIQALVRQARDHLEDLSALV